MKKILGFDISSSCIGWGLLEFTDDWQLNSHQIGYIKPPKEGHIAERLKKTKQEIIKVLDKTNPDEVVIEDILLQHKGGPNPSTTIKTLSTLAVFNRTVCLAVFEKLNKLPHLYAVIKIRHAIKTSKKVPSKEEAFEIINSFIPNISWPIQTKGKNKGKPIKESLDISDGLNCAYAYYKLTTRPEKVKKSNAKKRGS